MGVIIEARAIGMSRAQGFATPQATPGHTGRPVLVDSNYGIVKACAFLETQEEMRSHSLWRQLTECLATAPVAHGGPVLCFRGRYIDDYPPASKNMGPPSKQQCQQGGRYNGAGSPVLYLCDSEYGVRRELVERPGALYVQRYRLPTNQVRLADFRTLTAGNLLNAVFALCEDCYDASREADQSSIVSRGGPKSYCFSQTVANLVKEAGFDGMLVCGVRGENVPDERGFWHAMHYCNVVVFNCERWEDWLLPGSQPYVL